MLYGEEKGTLTKEERASIVTELTFQCEEHYEFYRRINKEGSYISLAMVLTAPIAVRQGWSIYEWLHNLITPARKRQQPTEPANSTPGVPSGLFI